jgi:ankyrin repeat protein
LFDANYLTVDNFIDGQQPLSLAILCNIPMIIRFPLERGADVNSFDRDRRTPLCHAVVNDGSPELVDLLLQKGVDPYIADFEDIMPF